MARQNIDLFVRKTWTRDATINMRTDLSGCNRIHFRYHVLEIRPSALVLAEEPEDAGQIAISCGYGRSGTSSAPPARPRCQ